MSWPVAPGRACALAPRCAVVCSGGRSGGKGRGKGPRRRAAAPGLFEVKQITPPPASLGIHALPPNTHNGDQIEVAGKDYVVTSVVVQYKLHKGRYHRHHHALEVQPTWRYFTNLHLDALLAKAPAS